MIKLTIAAITAITFSLVWAAKRASARRRLAEYDAGKRCIGCEGTEMRVANGQAQCQTCGHTASLADLQRVKLTEAEIATMTRPN
jgi:hypothetical protein